MLWIIVLMVVVVIIAVVGFLFVKRNKSVNAVIQEGRDDDQERNKIYVGNLNYRVRESDLKEMFASYGNVSNVRVVRHIKTRKSQGFAFVSFSTSSDATKALRAHGKPLQGRTMVVRLAKER